MNDSSRISSPLPGKLGYQVVGPVRHVPQTHPHRVLVAYDLLTMRRVILKQLNLEALSTSAQWQHAYNLLCRELALLRRICHPHIPRLLDVVSEGEQLTLVFQYIAGQT